MLNTCSVRVMPTLVVLLAYASICSAQTDSTGITPLIDFQPGELYQGVYEGGLYPGAVNTPPAMHLASAMAMADEIVPRNALGNSDPDGVIVMLSIGFSNTAHEFAVFERQEDLSLSRNARLIIINGALGGQAASLIANPTAAYWTVVQQRLIAMGLTAEQVQVVWLKNANASPPNNFPIHAEALRDDFRQGVQNLHNLFGNLAICYLSSRIYGGNATGPLNPEPQAYESGYSIKWLIEEQIDGDASLNFDPIQGAVRAPLLLWGPYLWADGIIPRSDGLVWLPEDFEGDGVHPAATAEQKVADLLSAFFASDGTTQSWFPSQGNGFLVSIDADADAFVRSAAPTENLGSHPTLRARGGANEETAFMRFDASAVQGEILWAKLSLRLPTQSQAPEQAVSLVTDTTWQESTITFSNAPAIDGGLLASLLTASRDATIAADVAQAIASDGDEQLSFAITSSVSQPSSFSSKESGQPPRLIVAVATSGPEAIPTASGWGLLVMTLLMLTAGTMVASRRWRAFAVEGCE